MPLPPIIARSLAHERLGLIFPSGAFDTVLSNPLAAAAVTALLYIGAVVDDDGPLTGTESYARPTTCLWMQPEVLERTSDEEREAWRKAATLSGTPKDTTEALVTGWGLTFRPWYGDNTRETLRDETLPLWAERGAVRARHDLPTTSSRPRWALTVSFAALFDPALTGEPLTDAIDAWREVHMDALDRLRIATNADADAREHAVVVTLPNGDRRNLAAGEASMILRGIVEQWAPKHLARPVVVTLSEPGTKVYVADAAVLASLGLMINVSELLPDALIADIGVRPPLMWVVEVAHSDGPVSERRKGDFLRWAADQRIDPANVRFVSAFMSRTSASARRRLKDIAIDTTAWFLDEPDRELTWQEIGEQGQ